MTRIKDVEPHFICRECGSVFNRYDFNFAVVAPEADDKIDVCFECAYWLNKISTLGKCDFVIDGVLYHAVEPVINEASGKIHILGQDGVLTSTSSLLTLGEVPEHFRDRLPDTAQFLTRREARLVAANSCFQCRKKGCWDRTRCYWYSGEMDWNEIPTDHVDGDEECPMYINSTYKNPKP